MRLKKEEKQAILDVTRRFDPEAQVRLFGSRTDHNLRGGDIDLLVLSKILDYRDKLRIRYLLRDILGNRKIDIIITSRPSNAFEQHALDTSLELS